MSKTFKNVDWEKVAQLPTGQLRDVPGIGPTVWMGMVSPDEAKRVQELTSKMDEYLVREPDLKAAAGKRPLIERTFTFGNDGKPYALAELSDREFKTWAVAWYKKNGVGKIRWGPLHTSFNEREQVLRDMVNRGISPLMKRE